MKKRTAALAALAPAFALALAATPAQAAATGEIIGYPGPDGLIWIADQAGSGGFVSGGLSSPRVWTRSSPSDARAAAP
ncbi:hypothetical protein [Streptomyces sp. NRRL F-4474]|uniref:hypothetical protein n=1 Tax=Streptomyces sp. NRRL F-4474 TaxID=1463851 RepID=UPI0004CA050B|nr:hypothetical protein [Streptomyces sp. NRRL F-4474]